jgi:5-methylcytosine-specific restriction endonuclease McrA
LAKYQSKYKKRFLRWKKTTRNHVARMKAIGTWHGLPRLTWNEWKARLVEFDNRCGYCLEQFDPDVLWLEHIVGIGEGGPHRIENVIPTCQLCNQTKGNKTLWEFKEITVEELFQRVRDKIDSIKKEQE